jgi:hypothetical protein
LIYIIKKEIFSVLLHMLNKHMKLQQIRERIAYNANSLTPKSATRNWLRTKRYSVALTLTLKQAITVQTSTYSYKRKLQRKDCDLIATRFKQVLNKLIFGNAAKRYKKSLSYFVVVEGELSSKNLHLHLAIGDLPKHIKFNEIDSLVTEAKKHICELNEQHIVKVCDSDWINYITKEISYNNTDNVLWQLM